MCLNPVRVSVKVRPAALAMVSRNLEETVEARRWRLDLEESEALRCWETSQWPSRAPSSLPLKTLQNQKQILTILESLEVDFVQVSWCNLSQIIIQPILLVDIIAVFKVVVTRSK